MCWNVGGLSTGLFDGSIKANGAQEIGRVFIAETAETSRINMPVLCACYQNKCFQPRRVRHQTLMVGCCM